MQAFNFGFVSIVVYSFTQFAQAIGILSKELADGMIICSCLPITVNMVVIMTTSCGGDEGAAVFNAACSNLVSIFLSPLLILGYLGVSSDVNVLNTFIKLILRVVVPLFVGQIIRKTSNNVVAFVKGHKKKFKKVQELSLIYLVYTVFCRTFMNEPISNITDVLLMILYQFILLSFLMTVAWISLKVCFSSDPSLRVMGLFGCSFKTVAIGIPLIGSMYENNPNVGLYTLPLLVWHPMQLVISSALVPRLRNFMQSETDKVIIGRTQIMNESSNDVEASESIQEND